MRIIVLIFLLTATPLFALTAYYLCFNKNGDLLAYASEMSKYGLFRIHEFFYDNKIMTQRP